MTLSQVVRDSRVVVSVGSGGVGKTTCAAILAMQAARLGRRALVMTVDPARRLANALGEDGLDHDIRRIDLDVGDSGGELWATMLDMKRTFDAIVGRYAPNDETRDRILGNRFYHYFSTSLAGSQELSASERLYEVVESGQWDLIVLDTPPTTNALDFLDAPVRFFDALDSAALQWVLAATGFARKGGGLIGVGAQLLLRTLGRFTGQDFFQELGEFLFHFSGLLDGIRERSEATRQILQDASTRLLIVTSPDPATIDEALYFRGRLDRASINLGGVIVNRVRRPFVDNRLAHGSIKDVADAIGTIDGAAILGRPIRARIARKLLENAHELDRLAVRDRLTVGELAELVGGDVPVVTAPMYATDVHTIAGLERMRRDIFSG